ncbi:MAG: transporter substrate-binding domain-containing protein [Cyclobacteriaceae bacterium]|nr:transporter substrate-binding domain-containing protein [Cyclobacteriaceae bacterium]
MARKQAVLFFLIIALLAAQCKPATDNPAFTQTPQVEFDLLAIQKRGYLEAIIDNNSISYFIYKGTPMGYEYEMLQYFCKSLKVKLKIRVISGINEAITKLNEGGGDVLAFPLTITKERTNYISFSSALYNTHQVLVQKKSTNWRMQPTLLMEKRMIRNPIDLIGKEVYVLKGSSFSERMKNLSQEIGGDIQLKEDSATAETESLIRQVATGEIQYTVTDQTIAMVNSLYYPNLDISTVLSLPQQIAWGMRKNSPKLQAALDAWLVKTKQNGLFQTLYNKYFNNPRFSITLASSDYSSLTGDKLSPFDEKIKEGAKQIGWDWRLIASIVYQESNFNPKIESWAGAIGLMQIMPETGKFLRVADLWDPSQNIKAGIRFLKFLDDYWAKTVSDPTERLKFVLASYNMGTSHVIDAQKLTRKNGRNASIWDNSVEYFLLQKSNPKYYRDKVVTAGYCRCDGSIRYVKEILDRYEEYKIHIDA